MNVFTWDEILTVLNTGKSLPFFDGGCGISIGSFDGCHKGHRKLLSLLIEKCNETDKLISILKRIKSIGNGYYKRRVDTVIHMIRSHVNGTELSFDNKHDKVFDEAKVFIQKYSERPPQNPFTPQFIKGLHLTEATKASLQSYITSEQGAGKTIERILEAKKMELDDKRIVVALMRSCVRFDQRNGLVAIIRSDEMKTYHSEARKRMFFIDLAHSGVFSFDD